MNTYTIKPLFLTGLLLLGGYMAQGQFDDVYYDPDSFDPGRSYSYDSSDSYAETGDVTYYDDSGYAYDDYDDYDYYYSSRIRRFHRPVMGVGFFDPFYTGFHFYDPFAWDAYYYPGASIYVNFGGYGFNDYHRWRRWNRWNRWNNWGGGFGWNAWGGGFGWNSWGWSPAQMYYGYNGWGAPGFNYWGGVHNYYGYANFYNNYYNNCPFPVSNWNGINHTTVNVINQGSTRGRYYGPRVTGNTGSSPRGPVDNPGAVQPVFKGERDGVTDNNDTPRGVPDNSRPGLNNPGAPVNADGRPLPPKQGEDKDAIGGIRQVPVDKEIPKTQEGSKRPVFRPDPDRYQPYPSNPRENPATTPDRPTDYRPNTPAREPQPDRPAYTPPSRPEQPRYTPPSRDDKPAATPPRSARDEKPEYRPTPRTDDRPAYRPTPRTDDRPAYRPTPRQEERPSYTPRSNDRPSYSPSRNSGGSSSSSNRSSGSGSSSRSSGSSSSGGRTSPRGG